MHYLILDANKDNPMWVLVCVERTRGATLDSDGKPIPGEHTYAMLWATKELGSPIDKPTIWFSVPPEVPKVPVILRVVTEGQTRRSSAALAIEVDGTT